MASAVKCAAKPREGDRPRNAMSSPVCSIQAPSAQAVLNLSPSAQARSSQSDNAQDSSSQANNAQTLPSDCLAEIFRRLPTLNDVARAGATCGSWRSCYNDVVRKGIRRLSLSLNPLTLEWEPLFNQTDLIQPFISRTDLIQPSISIQPSFIEPSIAYTAASSNGASSSFSWLADARCSRNPSISRSLEESALQDVLRINTPPSTRSWPFHRVTSMLRSFPQLTSLHLPFLPHPSFLSHVSTAGSSQGGPDTRSDYVNAVCHVVASCFPSLRHCHIQFGRRLQGGRSHHPFQVINNPNVGDTQPRYRASLAFFDQEDTRNLNEGNRDSDSDLDSDSDSVTGSDFIVSNRALYTNNSTPGSNSDHGLTLLFQSCPDLSSLYLLSSETALDLSPGVISHFTRLTCLSLSVITIPPSLLPSVTRLCSLTLHVSDPHCPVACSSAPFNHLSLLSHLELRLGPEGSSGFPAPRLSRDAFSGLQASLTSLSLTLPLLSQGELTSLPASLWLLTSLRSLCLRSPAFHSGVPGHEYVSGLAGLRNLSCLQLLGQPVPGLIMAALGTHELEGHAQEEREEQLGNQQGASEHWQAQQQQQQQLSSGHASVAVHLTQLRMSRGKVAVERAEQVIGSANDLLPAAQAAAEAAAEAAATPTPTAAVLTQPAVQAADALRQSRTAAGAATQPAGPMVFAPGSAASTVAAAEEVVIERRLLEELEVDGDLLAAAIKQGASLPPSLRVLSITPSPAVAPSFLPQTIRLDIPSLASSSLRVLKLSGVYLKKISRDAGFWNGADAVQSGVESFLFPNLLLLELRDVHTWRGKHLGKGLMKPLADVARLAVSPWSNLTNFRHQLLQQSPNLQILHIDTLPPSARLPVLLQLQVLVIEEYVNAGSALASLSQFVSLHTLRFNGIVSSYRRMVDGTVSCPPSLLRLQVCAKNITSLPRFLWKFTSITHLDLINCSQLKMMPTDVYALLPSLQCFRVDGCGKLADVLQPSSR